MKKSISIWKWFTVIALLSVPGKLHAQETDSVELPKKWEVRGYLKSLQSLTFDKKFKNLMAGNMLHNRLNVRWMPTARVTAAADFRTRLIWGDEVRLIPDFASQLRNANEAIDLTYLWIDDGNLVIQTTIDRLWLEYKSTKLTARVGCQRINWGIGTIWNPNDIFNTYNFLDFDYEERPGRDAASVRYHFSGMSHLEISAAASDDPNRTVVALKYFTNYQSYDFQVIAGRYHEAATIGAGWSGNIDQVGFKGELQYFFSHRSSAQLVNATLEADYIFANGWYLNVGGLLNSMGIDQPILLGSMVNFQLSPKSLMPTKWNAVVTLSKEITPLLSGNVTAIYTPGANMAILLPSLKYNLATNLDADIVWQSFFAGQKKQFEAITHRAFLRLKWSF